jgi:hypothetical protein
MQFSSIDAGVLTRGGVLRVFLGVCRIWRYYGIVYRQSFDHQGLFSATHD